MRKMTCAYVLTTIRSFTFLNIQFFFFVTHEFYCRVRIRVSAELRVLPRGCRVGRKFCMPRGRKEEKWEENGQKKKKNPNKKDDNKNAFLCSDVIINSLPRGYYDVYPRYLRARPVGNMLPSHTNDRLFSDGEKKKRTYCLRRRVHVVVITGRGETPQKIVVSRF